MSLTLASLHVYPVKSARAVDVESAVLTPTGLRHDRGFVLVDARGRFMTQRELPALATLAATPMGKQLQLEVGAERTRVPLHATGPSREVRVWSSDCLGIDCGDAVAEWLAAQLGHPLRLLRFDDTRPRACDPAWTGDLAATTLYSDGYPLLVANAASLAALNQRLEFAVPMDRFRPNLVLDGLAAWDEDRLLELACGDVRLRLVKPCARCIVPTTDQKTGERQGDEVIRLLRELRFDRALNGFTFGWNALVVEGAGRHLVRGMEFSPRWR